MADTISPSTTTRFQRDRVAIVRIRALVGGIAVGATALSAMLFKLGIEHNIEMLVLGVLSLVIWLAICILLRRRDNVMMLVCNVQSPGQVRVISRLTVRFLRRQPTFDERETTKAWLNNIFRDALLRDLRMSHASYYASLLACSERDHARYLAHLRKSPHVLSVLDTQGLALVDAMLESVEEVPVPASWLGARVRTGT